MGACGTVVLRPRKGKETYHSQRPDQNRRWLAVDGNDLRDKVRGQPDDGDQTDALEETGDLVGCA